jgi:hypothetical protein
MVRASIGLLAKKIAAKDKGAKGLLNIISNSNGRKIIKVQWLK